MKITERDFMVGDWVMVAECVADAHFVEYPDKIESIRDGLVGLESDGLETIIERVDPIPLTAEILERNGWSYNNEDAKYAAETWAGNGLMLQENGVGYRIVVVSDYDDEDTNDTQFVITYIHQLQHALRLAGIDKEITL